MTIKNGFATISAFALTAIIFVGIPAQADSAHAADIAQIKADLATQDAANAKGDTNASEQFDTSDFQAIGPDGKVLIHSKAEQVKEASLANATSHGFSGHTSITTISFSGNTSQATLSKTGSFIFTASGKNYRYAFHSIVIQTWTKVSGKWMEKLVTIKSSTKKITPA